MGKFLDSTGLSYLWSRIKTRFETNEKDISTNSSSIASVQEIAGAAADGVEEIKNTLLPNKVDKVSGKGLSTNDFTTALKNKLDGIATGATKVTVDSALSTTSSNPVQNKIITDALAGKSDSDHTHSAATTTANGLMSSTDKAKLDGIATGANKITVDSSLSSSSTNPVQNKVINTALAGKASSTHSHDEATSSAKGMMSSTDKAKLDALPTLTVLESTYAKKSDITSAYKAKGNSATVPTLSTVSVGDVYNITASFTTTTDFVEGAGKTYPAGTNIVKNSDSKWDVMAGFVDLSGYLQTTDVVALTNAEIDNILAS